MLPVGAMPRLPASAAGQVRQDVGVQVGGDDGVEAGGLERHAHGHGVDQHLVPGHVRELVRHLLSDLVPHHHAKALGVALGHHGQQLARPGLRQAEGVTHDTGDADPGQDGHLGRDLHPAGRDAPARRGRRTRPPSSRARSPNPAPARRTSRSGEVMPGRMRVGRTLAYWSKRLADRQAQAPQRDVVRHVRRADRAEADRVECA